MSNLKKILVNKISCKHIWFMRQAGRYLPEFRKIRKKNKDFIKLCLNSKLSSEITLQPIKRFNLDSAIIFSDILMIPYALGQKVEFEKNRGPKLNKFNYKTFLETGETDFLKKLNPIYKAIKKARRGLKKEKSLICFIGAPWTLIVYMFHLKNANDSLNIKRFRYKKGDIDKIINKLIKFCCLHIKNQINAGADVVQIFDSWAGLIPINKINAYCYLPNAKIVKFCKKNKIPNICFPKGIKKRYERFNKVVKPDGLSIDFKIDPVWAKKKLKGVVLQGGLDPRKLLSSEEEMIKGATKYIKTFKDIPYVFNLGHGLLPETVPGKLKKLIKFYRNF